MNYIALAQPITEPFRSVAARLFGITKPLFSRLALHPIQSKRKHDIVHNRL